MKKFATKILLASALIAVSACSGSGFPTLIGSDSQESIRDNGNIVPAAAPQNTAAGTFAGQKIESFHRELEQIKASFSSNQEEYTRISQNLKENFTRYNTAAAEIENKLRAGTTPGNPELSARLNQAQNDIQTVSTETDALNALITKLNENASAAARLHDSIGTTLSLSGTTEEDRSRMENLQKESKDLLAKTQTAAGNAAADSARWQQTLNTAENKIGRLYSGIRAGKFQKPAPAKKPTLFGTASDKETTPAASGEAPLFIAKFKNDDNSYKEGLGTAVKAAINSKNNAVFDVMAVSDSLSSAEARLYAKRISEEIKAMGVSSGNINLSEEIRPQTEGAEVWIFVR